MSKNEDNTRNITEGQKSGNHNFERGGKGTQSSRQPHMTKVVPPPPPPPPPTKEK